MALQTRDLEAELVTGRLILKPITTADAEEFFVLLQEPSLYSFTKGFPPGEITEIYERLEKWQTRKSPSGDEIWLNWTVRLKSTAVLVGHAQASVADCHAELAWVTGVPFQRHGYATEAAVAVAAWIRATLQGRELRANIPSAHEASQRIARRIGLEPSPETTCEGEIVWKRGSTHINAMG